MVQKLYQKKAKNMNKFCYCLHCEIKQDNPGQCNNCTLCRICYNTNDNKCPRKEQEEKETH